MNDKKNSMSLIITHALLPFPVYISTVNHMKALKEKESFIQKVVMYESFLYCLLNASISTRFNLLKKAYHLQTTPFSVKITECMQQIYF